METISLDLVTQRTKLKSRDGCLVCKARKIKCSETKPTCNSCLQKHLTCEYPTRPPTSAQAVIPAPRPLLPTFPGTAPSKAQYFNHYVSVTYPFLPAGNENVWRTHIPQYAHHNEHVMAAVLGLSAAHFHSMQALQYHYSAASNFRAQALAGLKDIMSKNEWNSNEVDAVVAISYLLGFQSRLMTDGFVDFLTMLRGTTLLSEHIISNTNGGSFRLSRAAMSPSPNAMAQLNLPDLDWDLLRKGLKSLQSVKHILTTAEHSRIFNELQRVLEAFSMSTARGLAEYSKFVDSAASLFFQADDWITKLLQSYLVALILIMDPVKQQLYGSERQQAGVEREETQVTVAWGKGIFQDMPAKLKGYAEWSEAVMISRG